MRRSATHYMSARVVLFGIFIMLVMIFDGLVIQAVDESFAFSLQTLRGEVYEQVTNPNVSVLKGRVVDAEGLIRAQAAPSVTLLSLSRILPEGAVIDRLAFDANTGRLSMEGSVDDAELVEEMRAVFDASEFFLSNEIALRNLQSDGRADFTAHLQAANRGL